MDQNEPHRAKPKVFLSYASASRDRAGLLAKAVQADGFDVWWDHAVLPGDDYREKTEAALAEADLAIVCWTPAACGSDWVLSEADDARLRDILVPVRLGACQIPKPFDRIFTSDLSNWLGDRQSPKYVRLIEVLRARRRPRTGGSALALEMDVLAEHHHCRLGRVDDPDQCLGRQTAD